jgi:hypothetical protein
MNEFVRKYGGFVKKKAKEPFAKDPSHRFVLIPGGAWGTVPGTRVAAFSMVMDVLGGGVCCSKSQFLTCKRGEAYRVLDEKEGVTFNTASAPQLFRSLPLLQASGTCV